MSSATGNKFTRDPAQRLLSRFLLFSPPHLACELLSEGVAAIFGPGTPETSGIVSSIADTFEVPHIIAHWEREEIGSRRSHNDMTLNVFPDNEVLSRAFAELLTDYTWKSYTIVYEDDDGLMRLKDILQVHDTDSPPITVR
jgi:glutamate receptor, ionotropic, invertebrate